MASSAVTPSEGRRRSRRWSGTATTGAAVRPPTTLASAPSMPATTTTASAVGQLVDVGEEAVQAGHADVGEAARREAVGAAARARTRRPPSRRPSRRRRPRPAPAARRGPGRHTTVVPVGRARRGGRRARPGLLVVRGAGEEHGPVRRGRAARRRWPRTARASCPVRRPPRACPGAAGGGGRRGRSRGRRRAGARSRRPAVGPATSPAATSSSNSRRAAASTSLSCRAVPDRRESSDRTRSPAGVGFLGPLGHVHRAGAAHPARPGRGRAGRPAVHADRAAGGGRRARSTSASCAIENSIEGTVNLTQDAPDLQPRPAHPARGRARRRAVPRSVGRGRRWPTSRSCCRSRSPRRSARRFLTAQLPGRRAAGRQLDRRGRSAGGRGADAGRGRHRAPDRRRSCTASRCWPPTSPTTTATRPASSSWPGTASPAPTGHDKTTRRRLPAGQRAGQPDLDPAGVRGPAHQPVQAGEPPDEGRRAR